MGSYTFGLNTEKLLAIISIILLTWINTRGIESGKWIQNIFTSLKVIALLGIILVGFTIGKNTAVISHNLQNLWSGSLTFTGTIHKLPLLGAAMVG